MTLLVISVILIILAVVVAIIAEYIIFKPRCPTCMSTNVMYVRTDGEGDNFYRCMNCGAMFVKHF
jgi:transposase-like protein